VIEPRYVDEIEDGILGDGWCSDGWEKLPVLRRCYVRPLSPDGDVEHVWQGHFEAAVEARDTAHQIFRSQNDWQLFLQGHRDVASDWDLAKHSYGERPRIPRCSQNCLGAHLPVRLE
jgi:hypothetical protein